MRKIIILSAAAMLAVAAGCGSKGSSANKTNKSLGPDPRPLAADPPKTNIQTPTPPPETGLTGVPGNNETPPPTPPPTPSKGTKYVVQRGDTLWSIAVRTYGDGKQYKRIVAANPSIRGDRIAAGQTLVLP